MREKMSEVRIIKRYQNRKLYDTHQSCYVTLEEIAQIIREGHEIQVIDNKTKNDITYMTQIQLLFDQERKSSKPGNVDLLKRVIRCTEGTFTGYIKGLEGYEEVEVSNEAAEVVAQEFQSMMGNNEAQSSSVETSPLN